MSNFIKEPAQPMIRLFKYLANYKSSVSFSVSSSVINKIFDLMPPLLTAWMIDTVSGQTPGWIGQWTSYTDPWTIIIFLSVLTLVIFGFESLFEWMFKRGFMRLAQRVQHDLRIDAYNCMQSRELAFFEEERTGNLMAMLNDDINQLERFLNNSFNEIIQLITLLLFAGWALCIVSLPLGIIAMLPIPLIVMGSLFYQRKVAPHYQGIRQAVGELGNRLENNISGISVIKSFTAESFESERVAESSRAYRDANFKAIHWSAMYIPLIRIFIALGFTAVLMIGSYWVLNDTRAMTLGSLAFFAMMIQRLLWPVTTLGRVFDEYERAKASSRRVFGLIDSPAQIFNSPQAVPMNGFQGDIKLEGLSFHYQKGQEVLQNISTHIQAGQTIGIAGPTGAGKTTLIKLLLRFYDVTNGVIRFDGTDIRQIELTQLRQQIGLVSQEVYLFHGSILANIAYGKEDYHLEEVVEAAKKARLHDFIASLPDGYESIIGERGVKLSGGQRQRLSIARAILKDALVLILDEATSSVDTETEKAIQQNLKILTTGKTAIIIAHRLSTIRHANHILVLKAGRIAEEGSHDDLLKQDGIYADLWNIQIGEISEAVD